MTERVVEILRSCGITRAQHILDQVRVPLDRDREVRAWCTETLWHASVYHHGSQVSVVLESYDHRGRLVDEQTSPIADVSADCTDPEAVAVFVLRHLLRAGRSNLVAHAYVAR